MRSLRVLPLLLVLAFVTAACGDDDATGSAADASTSTTSSSPPSAPQTEDPGVDNTTPSKGIVTLRADLASAAPGNGPGTSGSGTLRLDVGNAEICYVVTVKGLVEVTAAHLHQTNGEIVLALAPPNPAGAVDGCLFGLDRNMVTVLAGDPSHYRVDVHTDDPSVGALSGDLKAAN